MEVQAGALHEGGWEEQGRLQGALGGGGVEVQAGALNEGGGEEQGCLQGALGGGREKCCFFSLDLKYIQQ